MSHLNAIHGRYDWYRYWQEHIPTGRARSAAEISWIIAQYTGQLADHIRSDITYVDAEARIDVKDVLR